MTERGPSRPAGAGPIPAPAKINLYLKVLGRRPDGYHELDTVMVKLDLADRLWLDWENPLREDRLELVPRPGEAPDAWPPDFLGPDNLILKAAAAFRRRTGWPESGLAVRLEKNIPLGAGLGGGSSDCAAVLSALNRAAPEPLNPEELAELGLSLGADVPFFLRPEARLRARGVGQIFSRPPEDPAGGEAGGELWLANPGFQLSTARVFQNWDLTNPAANNTLGPISPPSAVGEGFGPGAGENDLLAPARRLAPELDEAADFIAGLKPSAWGLSGSGPTFWLRAPGLTAAAFDRRPHWWVRAVKIAS